MLMKSTSLLNTTVVINETEVALSNWGPMSVKHCRDLYAPTASSFDPIVTKVCWDSSQILRLPSMVIRKPVSMWPPPLDERGTSEQFFYALSSKSKPANGCLTRTHPLSPKTKMDESRIVPYVIIDAAVRAVYVSNLKSGSSTMTAVMTKKGLGRKRQKKPLSDVLVVCASMNHFSTGKRLIDRIAAEECGGKCNITCAGESFGPWSRLAHIMTTDLPDEIIENYFFFSFGTYDILICVMNAVPSHVSLNFLTCSTRSIYSQRIVLS